MGDTSIKAWSPACASIVVQCGERGISYLPLGNLETPPHPWSSVWQKKTSWFFGLVLAKFSKILTQFCPFYNVFVFSVFFTLAFNLALPGKLLFLFLAHFASSFTHEPLFLFCHYFLTVLWIFFCCLIAADQISEPFPSILLSELDFICLQPKHYIQNQVSPSKIQIDQITTRSKSLCRCRLFE